MKFINLKKKMINRSIIKKLSAFTAITAVMCLGFFAYINFANEDDIKKIEANALIYTSPEGEKFYEASLVEDRFGNPARYDISAGQDGTLYANVLKTRAMKDNSSSNNIFDFDYSNNLPNANSLFGRFIPEQEYILVFTGTGTNTVWFSTEKIGDSYYNGYTNDLNKVTITNPNEANFRAITYKDSFGTDVTDVTVPWLHSLTTDQVSKITTGIISSETNNIDVNYFFAGLPNLEEVRFDVTSGNKKKLKCLNGMFMSSGIKNVDFTNIDSSTVTDTWAMFLNCTNLEEFDLSTLKDYNPSLSSSSALMFYGCSKIKSLDFSSWNDMAIQMQGIVDNCTSLEYLNLKPFSFTSDYQYTNIKDLTNLKVIGLPREYNEASLRASGSEIELPSGCYWRFYAEDGSWIDEILKETDLMSRTTKLMQSGLPSYPIDGRKATYVMKSTEVNVNLNNLKLGDIVAFGKPNRTSQSVIPEDEKYKWRVVAFNDLDGDPNTGVDGKEAPLFMLDDWYYEISSGAKKVKKALFDSRVNNAYDPSDFVNTHLDGRSDANGQYDQGDYSPNRYATSDMRKFLNSNDATVSGFIDGQTVNPNTNATDTKGFLSRFGDEEKYLRTVPIKTLQGQSQIAQGCYNGGTEEYNSHKNSNSSFCLSIGWLFGSRKMATIYDDEAALDDDEMENYEKGYYEVTYDKVFLPSLKDMHDIYQNSISETNNNGWRASKYIESSLKYSGNDSLKWDDSHIRSFWLRDAGSLTTVGTFIYNMSGENITSSSSNQPGYMYKTHNRNYFSVKMKETIKSTLDGYPELDADPTFRDDGAYNVNDSSNTEYVKRCQTGIVPCCYLKEGTLFTYSAVEGAYVISGGTINESKEYAKVVTLETPWSEITRNDEIWVAVALENPDDAEFTKSGFEVYRDKECTNQVGTKSSTAYASKKSWNFYYENSSRLYPNKTYYVKTYVVSVVDGKEEKIYGTPYKITPGRPIIQNCYGSQGSTTGDDGITFKYRVLSLMGADLESIYIKGSVMGKTPQTSISSYYHGSSQSDAFNDFYHYAKWDDIKQFLAYTVYQDGYVRTFSKKIDKDSLVVSTSANGYQLNEVTVKDRFPANARVLSQVFTVFEPAINEKAIATEGYKTSINIIPYGDYTTYRSQRHYNVSREGSSHFFNWAAVSPQTAITGKMPITDNKIYFTTKFDDSSMNLITTNGYSTNPDNFPNNVGNIYGYGVLQNDLDSQKISNTTNFTGQYGIDKDTLAWYEYQKVGTTESERTTDTTSQKTKKYALKGKVKEREFSAGEGFYFPEIPQDYFEAAGYDYGQIIKNDAFSPHDGNTDIDGEEIDITMYFPRLGPLYIDENGKEYYTENEAIILKDSEDRLCKWDISKNQDGSVMAVVFKKQKNTNPIASFIKRWFWTEGRKGNYTTVDNENILVIYQGNLKEGNGAGEKAEFKYYSTGSNVHKVYDFNGDDTDFKDLSVVNIAKNNKWRFVSDTVQGNIVPWTLCLDPSTIKKVVLVDVDFSDYSGLFAGLSGITNENLKDIIIGEYETSDNQMTRNITNVKGMFAGCTSLSEIDLSMLGTSSVNVLSDNQIMFNGANNLKKIILPKSVPSNSDYDIILPQDSNFLVRDSDGKIVTTQGTNGTVTKLIARGTDNAEYLEIDESVWFLDQLNSATNDRDIKNLLERLAPGTDTLVIKYFDVNNIVSEKYIENYAKGDDDNLAINYTWEKLKEKRAKEPPEGYTTPEEFFNELKNGLDHTKYEVFTKDSYEVEYDSDFDFVIGGVGASNTKDLYVKFPWDSDYTKCSFGNNTIANFQDEGYLYLYKTLKDSQLLGNKKIEIGRTEVHLIPTDALILDLINNAVDETKICLLLTETNSIIDYINEIFDTGYYPDEDDYEPGFVDVLVPTLLYTEKEKSPYTRIEDVAKDIKSAFEAKPVLKVNNQSTKGTAALGGDANFEISISNSDARILDLLEVVNYEKLTLTPHPIELADIETMGAPPGMKQFVKLDDLCDDNYDVYANEQTVYGNIALDGDGANALILMQDIDGSIYKNGTVINDETDKDKLTFYYYLSCNPDYQYTHDTTKPNNGIAQKLIQIMSSGINMTSAEYDTTHITSPDQINNELKIGPYVPDTNNYKFLVSITFSPYWGTYENLDGTNPDSPPQGDSRLYIKVPKTYETMDSSILSGWTTMSETLNNVDENDFGIYRATVHVKNSAIEEMAEIVLPISTNSVELGQINVSLEESDVTFPSVTSFTYDGNAHYIEEIINPDKAGFSYTAEYHKGSATGEVIAKENIKDVGTYYLVITVDPDSVGPGSTTSWSKPFSIVQKSMGLITIDDSSVLSAEYTGSEIDPSNGFVIKDGDTTLDPSTYTITYEDSNGNPVTKPKDVGTYTVIISDKTGNYVGTKEFTFTVVSKEVTVTDDLFDSDTNLVLDKEYDGKDSYTFEGSINIEGENVPLNVNVKFDNKNIGENKTVTITFGFKNQSDSSKYGLSKNTITKTNGKITKRKLEWTATVDSKVFDGNNTIRSSDVHYNLLNLAQGDEGKVSLNLYASYHDQSAGENKQIDFTVISLSGDESNNYSADNLTINTGKIELKKIEYTISVANKKFDNSDDATGVVTLTPVASTIITNVNLEVESAKFADKGFGEHAVNVVLKITGVDPENYYVDQPQNLKAKITKDLIKVTFITSSKVYDGTKDASSCVSVDTVTNEAGADVKASVPVKISSATFDNKNAGSSKTISVVPEFENVSDKENFDFEFTTYTLTNGEITPKPLTYQISVNEKTYDGTKSATAVAVRNSYVGLISGDNPTITLSNGMFSTKDAGENITATFDAAIDDSNYSITQAISGEGNIKKRDLHIDATTDDGEYEIGDPIAVHFALRDSDLVTGESVGISTASGSGVVEESSNKRVKKVNVNSWPTLTGGQNVIKNYNEVHSDCFVNLSRIDLSNERLEITIVTRDYFDGTPKEVNVSIKFPELGVTLIKDRDFTFEYLDDHTDLGSHDIKITFIGEYKGEKTASFEIKEKPAPTPSGGGGGGGGGVTYTVLPKDEIIEMHLAFMKGYEDKTFRPQDAISREEVATIVARCDSEFNEDFNFTSHNTFPDVDTRWSKNYIGFCKLKDLVHGYEDGTFGPTRYMTRAELATLVNNFLRVQNASFDNVDLTKPAFSDVEGKWYEESVNKLAYLGILNGYEDGTFKGDNYVTRIEVTIVMNKINHRTVTVDVPKEYVKKITSAFKDITADRWFFKDVAESVIDHPADLY